MFFFRKLRIAFKVINLTVRTQKIITWICSPDERDVWDVSRISWEVTSVCLKPYLTPDLVTLVTLVTLCRRTPGRTAYLFLLSFRLDFARNSNETCIAFKFSRNENKIKTNILTHPESYSAPLLQISLDASKEDASWWSRRLRRKIYYDFKPGVW